MSSQGINACPICGGREFSLNNVLWPSLIEAWELLPAEVEYINRQQGMCCAKCGNNLRAMALASAIRSSLGFQGSLECFCNSSAPMRILEINHAGNLTIFLKQLPGHKLVEYPEFDMESLEIDDDSFDLVIHSDTLEHIADPVRGLSECRRVLKREGKCAFTIPIIIGRLSRSRKNLLPSFHGGEGVIEKDQLVYTEFGSNFWTMVLEAGFVECGIHALEYPSGLAIIAGH